MFNANHTRARIFLRENKHVMSQAGSSYISMLLQTAVNHIGPLSTGSVRLDISYSPQVFTPCQSTRAYAWRPSMAEPFLAALSSNQLSFYRGNVAGVSCVRVSAARMQSRPRCLCCTIQ